MMANSRNRTAALALSALLLVVGSSATACSSSGETDAPGEGGGDDRADDGGGRGGGTSASAGRRSGSGGGVMTPSGGGAAGAVATTTAACDNGQDDDGDGLVDGFDPECTGPLDGDEGTFATGIPGDNRDPKWQDCFFDGNSGAGDDGCRYHTDCLYGKLPPGDEACRVTEQCLKFCRPLTQNGCDCFGCCTIELGNGSRVDVVEAATCSLANIDDAKACPRCTKSQDCSNDCGECELCPGKTTLPASCGSPPPSSGGGSGGASGTGGASGKGGAPNLPPDPPAYTCDNGEQVCGPDLPPCANAFEYCSFGCCIASVR